jgi:poly(A) polymerase
VSTIDSISTHWPDSAPERFARRVAEQLSQAGHLGYFAGGCVRDAILGKPPKDFDVATDATPTRVREVFGNRRTLAIGAQFGVICVLGNPRHGEGQVDVATFRSDGTYLDGRRPEQVVFSSPEEDAQRRDFTMNGLFFDPVANRIIDYVGGQQDLAARCVRAIGQPLQRFEEDKLRMLRAVRFTATYGFTLEPTTADAVSQYADQIVVVSSERIAAELRRMWGHSSASQSVSLLAKLGLMEAIWPTASVPWNAAIIDPIISLVDALPSPSFAAVTGLLLHAMRRTPSTAADDAAVIQSHWKLSTEERSAIRDALLHAPSLIAANQLAWSELQPRLLHPSVQTSLAVATAIASVEGHSIDGLTRCIDALGWPKMQLDPPPLLRGEDLSAAGFPPGPLFRKLLEKCRQMQLDQQLPNHAAALDWLAQQTPPR